jgi:MFS family permease
LNLPPIDASADFDDAADASATVATTQASAPPAAAPPAAAPPPSIWRSRPLVALLAAQGVSSLGSQMTFLALPWFVLATTGSPTRMALVLAAEILPVALLGILSGSVVARLGARRTMLVGDAARAPLRASIPILYAAGVLTFPFLLVIVALVGVFIAPYFSSQRIAIPELIGEDETAVSKANAVVEGTSRLASLLGPVLAGVLIGLIGAPNVLYVDAATFAFAFVVLALFVPARPPVAQDSESRGVLAGLRYLLGHRVLRVLGLTAMLVNGLAMMLVSALPVLAYDDFDASPRVAGAFFTAFGIGAVVGTLATMPLLGRFDPLRLGAVAFVALTIPLFALAFSLPAAGVMAALALSSFFGPLVNAPLMMVLTTRTPEALRPKVITALITTAMLAGPIGYLLAGPLLEAWGPNRVILLVATGQLLATIPFARVAFDRSAQESVETEPSPA